MVAARSDVERERDKDPHRLVLSMRTKVSIGGLCFLLVVGLTMYGNLPQATEAFRSVAAQGEPPGQNEGDPAPGGFAQSAQYPFQYIWRSEAKYPLHTVYFGYADGDPTVADLNQDGYPDVVIAKGSQTKDLCYVSAISGKDGKRLWEFGPIGGNEMGAVMIDDVTGDGLLEVIFADDKGTLYCLSGPFGSVLWSKEGYRLRQSVALFDVNKDGRKDIIIAARDPTGPTKNVTALDGLAGEVIWASPALSWYKYSPKICDIDGDGDFEVVTWDGEAPTMIYVMNAADGTLKWIMTALPGGPQMQGDGLIVDINSDGVLDFISIAANATGSWAYAYTPDLEALAKDKTAPVRYLWVRPGADTAGGNNEMAMGDLNGDGVYEFVHVQEVVPGAMYNILCRRLTDGEVLWNATAPGMYPKHSNFALADCDNDGLPDVVITSGYKSVAPTLNVFRGTDGSLLFSAPISSMSGPAVADVNNDGLLDIIVSGVAMIGTAPDDWSYVWALPTTTKCDKGEIVWGMHLRDHVNSGVLPIPEGAAVLMAMLVLGISVKRRAIFRRPGQPYRIRSASTR